MVLCAFVNSNRRFMFIWMTNGNYEGWMKEPIQSCLHSKGKQNGFALPSVGQQIRIKSNHIEPTSNDHHQFIAHLHLHGCIPCIMHHTWLLHRLQHTKIKFTSTMAINYKPLILMHFAERCAYPHHSEGLTFLAQWQCMTIGIPHVWFAMPHRVILLELMCKWFSMNVNPPNEWDM